MLSKISLTLLLVLTLVACDPSRVAPPRSADYYFKEGEQFFEQQRFDDAVASWKKVRDSYYSPELNKLAELKIAEAHYLNQDFISAAISYSAFAQQHPQDERLNDVLYFLGLSYYKQMLSKDRDQTITKNALSAFEQMLSQFPEDKRTEEVSSLSKRCRNRLVEHEVYVGRYYLRTGEYQAAINRISQALNDFPNYYYRDEAFYYLGSAYFKNHNKKAAIATFNQLFDQFPGSEYVLKAQYFMENNN